jgi:uncharacterized membrane protein YdjX (TVP38/TMEM64 family)
MTQKMTNGFAAKLPFLLILVVAGIGAFVLRDYLTFDALAENRDALVAFRDENYLLAVLGFILAYIAIVAFSLPGATITTLTGGFLFGIFPGVLFNVTAATIGATLIFLAAKHGFGARFADRMAERGGAASRLQTALQNNEWSALMIMRLAPVVPFFMANLIPAFVGARTSRYIITTFFGIMPGGLVFTSIGAGLDSVFASGEMPDLSILFAPQILLPILGLIALSALPIILKYVRKKPL